MDYVERTEYMLNGSQIIGETVYFSQDAGVTFTEQYTLIYLYDESSMPIGMMYRTPSYSDYAFDYYFFEKNLQGDIIAIYNASGTKIGSYTYDAWGNCTATSYISGYNFILHNNPFRYRGYYYDSETGYYYLQNRYYNPTWGRFLNADCVISGVGGSIHGYNMFVYCFNNPINMVDSKGDWPEWIEAIGDWINDNIIEPAAECVAQFLVDIIEDAINFDSDNADAEKVFDSNYFSSYNGVFVIKTPFDSSFSFGFIGLSNGDRDEEILKHECGHTVQLEKMGIAKYVTDVAIPSVTINLLDRMENLPYDYYSYPWEAEANKFGGATISQSKKDKLPEGEYNSYWDLIVLFFK